MAKEKKNIYVVQKFVSASSLAEALAKESKAEIVNVCLSIATPNSQAISAIGFSITPDGKEDIDYDK